MRVLGGLVVVVCPSVIESLSTVFSGSVLIFNKLVRALYARSDGGKLLPPTSQPGAKSTARCFEAGLLFFSLVFEDLLGAQQLPRIHGGPHFIIVTTISSSSRHFTFSVYWTLEKVHQL